MNSLKERLVELGHTLPHVVAPPVQVLDTTRVPWADGLSINPAPLRAMRKLWRLDDRPLANPGRMLFLSRTSANRGLVNEVRLAVIASEYGLEILDPGAMSFEDQLSAFSSASLLVGASGAVMANYLMMMPGSRILALTSDALTDFILPAAIAAVSGASFTYLSGPTTKSLAKSGTRNEWMHSDFLISEKQFRAALINALADQRRYLRHRDIIARPETAAAIREKGLDDVRV